MTRTKTLLLVLLLAAGGLVAWLFLRDAPPIKVHTARAERMGRLRSVVSASGEIRAREFVDIQAEVPGVIVELPVREGDGVTKGDVLLRLDDTQLRADLDASRALLLAAEADARSAEVGVATAEANHAYEETALLNLRVEQEQAEITRDRTQATYERKKELSERKLIPSEEHDAAEAEARLSGRRVEWARARVTQGEAGVKAARTRIDAAGAALEGSQRRVENARAGVARAEDLLGKTVIRSPLTGIITKLNVEKGERAVPGIQSNPQATLMTIANMSVIEAEIKVDETDIVNVKLAMPAEVEVDALRDVKMKGEVAEIGQSPIRASELGGGAGGQESKDFKVVVRLLAPHEALRPGFSATAEIETAVRENVLVIPLQALTMREVTVDEAGRYVPPPREEKAGGGSEALAAPSDGGGPPPTADRRERKKELEGVFVVEEGRARFRPVKTGITGEMEIQLLEGLEEGTEIVLGPYKVLRTLKEWDRVEPETRKEGEGELPRPRRERR